jgi:hypothetical protein
MNDGLCRGWPLPTQGKRYEAVLDWRIRKILPDAPSSGTQLLLDRAN